MALTAFTGSRSLDVVVRSLKSAKTLTGLSVALVAKDGETLATSRTGPDGRASFAHALLQGEGASTPKMLMAYGGAGDLAVLDLDRSPIDLSKQAGAGHDLANASGDITAGRTPKTAIDGYLYADRGVYRPGETVHITALVRDDQSRAVNDRRGYVEVLRPSGGRVQALCVRRNRRRRGAGRCRPAGRLAARPLERRAARRRLRRGGRVAVVQRRGFRQAPCRSIVQR